MNLKDFLANREKPPELYWSVVIEPGWVQAGVWYIAEGAANMVATSPGAAWEEESELVGAADAALSSAIQQLPENYPEPNKTVFGVPSSWVKGGEIADEYLAKIKEVCTSLSLEPVGFVVLPEAVAHLYKSEEGTPVSAVFVGLGSESLEVSVFKLGNLVGSTSVARSVSLVEDVTEGLSRFEGASPLPSRFIVFDGKGGELEEAKEILTQASWEEGSKIKFLHTPKVETLSADRKVLAASLAGATEIGQVSQIVPSERAAPEVSEAQSEEVENVKLAEGGLTPEELGFSLNEDITKRGEPSRAPMRPSVSSSPGFTKRFTLNDYFAKTKSLFHNFSGKFFPKAERPKSINKRAFTGTVIFLAIVFVGLGLLWWFYPKAHVTIYVTPRVFQEDVNMDFATNGESDVGSGIIPAELVSIDVSGDKTKATSGFKLIGDKAKGNVQIANGNSSPIDLATGTLLVSSAGLKFVTNSEASVSAQILPGSPGTANLDITAADIGAQYNLPKGEVFKVGNYSKSLVAATSTGDFSGGSSQQIAAVSQADQTGLEAQLKDELTGNAKDQLAAKVKESQIFVDDLAVVNIVSENFDHKVGDAADSLKLSLSIKATDVFPDKAKLLEYARGVLKDKIPQGFVLRDSQIDFKFVFVSVNDVNYTYKVTVLANFLPQVSTDAIVKQILGKTPSVAENYLTSIPGFARADVTLKPHFPGPFGVLPRVSKNIVVEVVAEK